MNSSMGISMESETQTGSRVRWALIYAAQGVLVYTVFVILWGAYVRATGSGAGCGEHWPLCNGVVIPRDPSTKTQIEFFHRLTSGLSLLSVIGLSWWVRLKSGKKTRAWFFTRLSLLFIVLEALVGAALVLLSLVAQNSSIARAIVLGFHLINTYLLLGSLSLTVLALQNPDQDSYLPRPKALWVMLFFGWALVGALGAVTARGSST
jgi:heme A synthase